MRHDVDSRIRDILGSIYNDVTKSGVSPSPTERSSGQTDGGPLRTYLETSNDRSSNTVVDTTQVADIAAIRAQLVRRGALRLGQHPQHPARSGSAPRRGWSVAVAAAMTVLALAPALRHSAESPPGALSRAVQPLVRAFPSGTEVQEEIFFVLEATASYYRDDRRDTIWQE